MACACCSSPILLIVLFSSLMVITTLPLKQPASLATLCKINVFFCFVWAFYGFINLFKVEFLRGQMNWLLVLFTVVFQVIRYPLCSLHSFLSTNDNITLGRIVVQNSFITLLSFVHAFLHIFTPILVLLLRSLLLLFLMVISYFCTS